MLVMCRSDPSNGSGPANDSGSGSGGCPGNDGVGVAVPGVVILSLNALLMLIVMQIFWCW